MLYKLLRGICKVISLIIFRVKTVDVENFNNTEGRCIICCNHITMIDPVIVACYTKRKINFMGKKELFEIPILKNLLRGIGVFPVDRHGSPMAAMKHAIALLKEDKVLGIFPEGTRVKGGFDEKNVKSGISLIANMAKAPIVPVFIKSSFKPFSRIDLVFGEPKDYFKDIEGRVTTEMHNEISKQILMDIYNLENKIK